MIHPIVPIFVFLSGAFALVHMVAIFGSLYWYYSWLDIVMHFWGGCLLALGLSAFSTFKLITIRPTLKIQLLVLLLATVSWEFFEFLNGLYDPTTYVFDTAKDLVMGFSGGLLTYALLKKLYNRTI